MAKCKKRLTGADLDTNSRWQVAGTDLGIPYVLENCSIGYLFGDTFNTARPEDPDNGWRSPVMLRSNIHPGKSGGIVFDSAAQEQGDFAPGVLDYVAYGHPRMAAGQTTKSPAFLTMVSRFQRQADRSSPFNHSIVGVHLGEAAMPHWPTLTMAITSCVCLILRGGTPNRMRIRFRCGPCRRDGEWVYVFSVRSGRQHGPMMLQRVHWRDILIKERYEGWGFRDETWGWGRPCTPILEGKFGEPSVRKLDDGTWAMCYLNAKTGNIVSRTASGPDRVWSGEKIQVTSKQEKNLYGGFIHPWSRRGANNLHIMVSKWTREHGITTAYHVSQYVGTL